MFVCVCVYYQLEKEGSLSAEELARLAAVSITLATERYTVPFTCTVCVFISSPFLSPTTLRLQITEKAGKACRDDSVEGLRFYPNRFLTEVS